MECVLKNKTKKIDWDEQIDGLECNAKLKKITFRAFWKLSYMEAKRVMICSIENGKKDTLKKKHFRSKISKNQ